MWSRKPVRVYHLRVMFRKLRDDGFLMIYRGGSQRDRNPCWFGECSRLNEGKDYAQNQNRSRNRKPQGRETGEGKASLADLFRGRSQLVVYHFMFGPGYSAGCPACSATADSFNGVLPHLEARDVTMICISRAPIEKLLAFRQRMGWSFNWASSYGARAKFRSLATSMLSTPPACGFYRKTDTNTRMESSSPMRPSPHRDEQAEEQSRRRTKTTARFAIEHPSKPNESRPHGLADGALSSKTLRQ